MALVDDRPWVHHAWQQEATRTGKTLCAYFSAQALYDALPKVAATTPIYIGQLLDNCDEDGHAVAQSLYVQGYTQLTMLPPLAKPC